MKRFLPLILFAILSLSALNLTARAQGSSTFETNLARLRAAVARSKANGHSWQRQTEKIYSGRGRNKLRIIANGSTMDLIQPPNSVLLIESSHSMTRQVKNRNVWLRVSTHDGAVKIALRQSGRINMRMSAESAVITNDLKFMPFNTLKAANSAA